MRKKPKWWREDEVLARVIKRDAKGVFIFIGGNKLRPMKNWVIHQYRVGTTVYVSDAGWIHHCPAEGIVALIVHVRKARKVALFPWV